MKDADLRREFHRQCRRKPGTLSDTEACFRAFKAGVEYGSNVAEPSDIEQRIFDAYAVQAQREEWEG